MWYKRVTADALNTDYLSNIHDKELREGVPPKTDIVVYHGTSMKKLLGILQHGSLDPAISKDKRNYDNSTIGGIYVTISFGFFSAEMYSNKSAEDGSDGVVLELVVPLGWIEQDPDDTRHDEKGEMNDLGKKQGIVRRPIDKRRIRQIKVHSQAFAQASPSPNNDFFSKSWSNWMSMADFYSLTRKLAKQKIPLPQEYGALVGLNLKGLSRQNAPIDLEQTVAEQLLTLWNTIFDIGSLNFEKVLGWVYKNKNVYNAQQGLQSFMEFARPGAYQEFMTSAPDNYKPKPGEDWRRYLSRVG